jgi:arylformamidase
MEGFRVVELSFDLYPGQEEYNLQLRNRQVAEMLPHYADKIPPDEWYVMSEVEMWSHVGTHMEAPLHHIKGGVDCAEIPLERVVGEACLVDFSDKPLFEAITLSEMQERGKNIQEGDIVFIRTGLDHFYRTKRSHDRPYFTPDAVDWLVKSKKIVCLGLDCSGIEKRDEPEQPNHKILLQNGIPLIEHLANLDQLTKDRFYVVAVPWRVHGLDASPVSVIALEPNKGD